MMIGARFLASLVLTLWSASGFAQTGKSAPLAGPSPPTAQQEVQPEGSPLDRLFDRLKAAPSAEAAKPLAQQIQRRFERSGSDTADLLLQRIKQSTEAKDYPLALDLSDFLLTLKPDWAEAYHRRAIVHFLLKDEESAMRDIRLTLAREPRHFDALAGLGALFRGMGNKKAAYQAFKKATEIHPYFEDLQSTLDKMKPEIEGQPI